MSTDTASIQKDVENTQPQPVATSSSGATKRKTHSFYVTGTKFVVDTRYQPLKPVGTGAYGVVCSALDRQTNRKVAIKKITNAFDDLVDAKRILREVKLLHHFKVRPILVFFSVFLRLYVFCLLLFWN